MIRNLFYIFFIYIFDISYKIFKFKLENLTLLSKFYLYLLRSNHPRRIELSKYQFIDNFIVRIIFRLKKKKKLENKVFLINNKNNLNKIFFIGDSHVEFLSRFYFNKNFLNDNNSYSLWLGPKTVLGFKNAESIDVLNKAIKFCNILSNNKDPYIFSLGSIDVRCIFYELLLRKIFKKQNDVFKAFEENLNYILKNIKKKCFNNKNIFFTGIVNLNVKGKEPKKIRELIKFKKKEQYAVLGSKKKINYWTSTINKIIEKNCKKYKIEFINIEKIIIQNKLKKNQISIDGAHYYSRIIYEDIYSKLKKFN